MNHMVYYSTILYHNMWNVWWFIIVLPIWKCLFLRFFGFIPFIAGDIFEDCFWSPYCLIICDLSQHWVCAFVVCFHCPAAWMVLVLLVLLSGVSVKHPELPGTSLESSKVEGSPQLVHPLRRPQGCPGAVQAWTCAEATYPSAMMHFKNCHLTDVSLGYAWVTWKILENGCADEAPKKHAFGRSYSYQRWDILVLVPEKPRWVLGRRTGTWYPQGMFHPWDCRASSDQLVLKPYWHPLATVHL